MKQIPAIVIQLSQYTQAVVTKDGAWLMRSDRHWYLTRRELQRLLETRQENDAEDEQDQRNAQHGARQGRVGPDEGQA